MDYLCFKLNSEPLAVDVLDILEIIIPEKALHIGIDYSRGVIDYKGLSVPLVNHFDRDVPVSDKRKPGRVIICSCENKTIGLIIDSAEEILRVGPDEITPAGAGDIAAEHIDGYLVTDDRRIPILSLKKIGALISAG